MNLKFDGSDSAQALGFLSQQPATGGLVYKRGGVSGATSGTVQHVKIPHRIDQSYVVFSRFRGSGMAIWGDATEKLCFVIPIQNVLADIKSSTRCTADLRL